MRSKPSPTSRSRRIKVGITVGDPAGIGPEIALKAADSLRGLADFLIIGDASRKRFTPGVISRPSGAASVSYLEQAVGLLERSKIDCLVTAPISKEAVRLAGFRFPGHTEYLAAKSAVKDYAMMLLNRRLKFSLLTTHQPLKEVPALITAGRIRAVVGLTVTGLKKYFGILRPRLAVCGLNPHASDNGLIGCEERKVIDPAARRCAKLFAADIRGALPADVAVSRALEGEFDGLIAMYHDQALIPLKATDKSSGVNLTLGLPFVRSSPLHGTAFDIAATPGKADPSSMIEAVRVAVKCASILKRA
jgi:4-hydroxythreonine-4-phosphate dehydrogenase